MARQFKCAVCHAVLTQSAADDGRCPRCSTPIRREAPPEHFITRGGDDSERMEDMAAPEKLNELQALFDGRYRFVRLLGQGGMGAVFKVIDLKLDREVALKILPAGYAKSVERTQRFEQEAKALAKLRHQGIVTVFDFGQERGIHWLAMEYVEGKTLREELERKGKLDVERVLRLVDRICDALGAAHDAGLVHRDIKPENILLTAQDEPRIVDFGLAKLLGGAAPGRNMSSEGRVLGTANYMSPEQQAGRSDVDVRSDVYSLGKVIYEMLSGVRPEGKFPSLSKVGAAQGRFDDLIAKALDPDPSRRHASIGALRAALPRRHAESARARSNSSMAKANQPSGWSDRKKWAMGMLGAIATGLLIWHYQREIGALLGKADERELEIEAALEHLDKGTNVDRRTAVATLRQAAENAAPELAARIVTGLAANLIQHSPGGYQPPADARLCEVCAPEGSNAPDVAAWWNDAVIAIAEARGRSAAVAPLALDRVGLANGDIRPADDRPLLLFADGSLISSDLRGSKWYRAALDRCQLTRSQLNDARFQSCRLVGAKLRGVCARKARLRLCNASGADFEQACLEGAHFTSCVLRNANFNEASLKDTVFTLVDLRGADFSGAYDLRADQLIGVEWDATTKFPASVSMAKLSASEPFDGSQLAEDVARESWPVPAQIR